MPILYETDDYSRADPPRAGRSDQRLLHLTRLRKVVQTLVSVIRASADWFFVDGHGSYSSNEGRELNRAVPLGYERGENLPMCLNGCTVGSKLLSSTQAHRRRYNRESGTQRLLHNPTNSRGPFRFPKAIGEIIRT